MRPDPGRMAQTRLAPGHAGPATPPRSTQWPGLLAAKRHAKGPVSQSPRRTRPIRSAAGRVPRLAAHCGLAGLSLESSALRAQAVDASGLLAAGAVFQPTLGESPAVFSAET